MVPRQCEKVLWDKLPIEHESLVPGPFWIRSCHFWCRRRWRTRSATCWSRSLTESCTSWTIWSGHMSIRFWSSLSPFWLMKITMPVLKVSFPKSDRGYFDFRSWNYFQLGKGGRSGDNDFDNATWHWQHWRVCQKYNGSSLCSSRHGPRYSVTFALLEGCLSLQKILAGL